MSFGIISRAETVKEFEEENITVNNDSKLTAKVISELSWDELVSKSQNITSKEDKLISSLINCMETVQPTKTYDDEYYYCTKLMNFNPEIYQFDSYLEKKNKVIDVYNNYHEMQVIGTSIVLNEFMMVIEIGTPVTNIGQNVYVEPKTKYWESSSKLGTGKWGGFSSGNLNTLEDNIIRKKLEKPHVLRAVFELKSKSIIGWSVLIGTFRKSLKINNYTAHKKTY